MKLMYVGKDCLILNKIKLIFQNEQYDYIHYLNPGKALNNIKEIDPDIFLFVDDHFPENGITVKKLLKSSKIPQETSCIFLSTNYSNVLEENFYYINSNFKTNENIDFFNNAVRKTSRVESKTQLVFSHPVSLEFVTGDIEKIDDNIIDFVPHSPDISSSIVENSILKICTLKVENSYFSFPSQVSYNSKIMKLEISKKISKKIQKQLKLLLD